MSTPGRQMSDALKDRLKKTSRFYQSPVARTNAFSSVQSPLCDTRCSPLLATPHQRNKSWSKNKTNSAFKSPVVNDQLKHPKLQTPRAAGHQTSDGEATRRTLVDDFIADASSLDDNHTGLLTELMKDDSSELDRGLKRKKSSGDESHITDDGQTSAIESLDDASSESLAEFLQRKKELLKMISEKEEKIRKLKMVKLYRSKHSLETLHSLTTKWKMVSQQAVLRLHSLIQEPRPTLTQLIDHLHIDYDMIDYNVDDESFI